MGVSSQASNGIDECISDAGSCTNMCFIDPAFRLIWKTFPSRHSLLSTACVGITRRIQMVASDNVANVERQRAGERRNSRIKEQTYLELVPDARAAHTLQQFCVILQDKTLTMAEALAKQEHLLAHGYVKQEVTRARVGNACPSKRERVGDALPSVKQERAGKELQPETQSLRNIDRYSARCP